MLLAVPYFHRPMTDMAIEIVSIPIESPSSSSSDSDVNRVIPWCSVSGDFEKHFLLKFPTCENECVHGGHQLEEDERLAERAVHSKRVVLPVELVAHVENEKDVLGDLQDDLI